MHSSSPQNEPELIDVVTDDVRGRHDVLPDVESAAVQERLRQQQWQTTAHLWKQRLMKMPQMHEIQSCILAQGVQHLGHSSLTHFGKGPPSEFFLDDFIVMKVTEIHGHFPNAGDIFCEELGETPANHPADAHVRRCGFQVQSKVKDDEMYIDFGIVRWHEIGAVACDAIAYARYAASGKEKPSTTIL